MLLLSTFLQEINGNENQAKFEKIYYKYEKKIFGIAFSNVKNFNDAEEIAQDLFFAIARSIESVSEDESAERQYIYKTLRNLIYDYFRKRSSEPQLADADVQDMPSFDISIEDGMVLREEVRLIFDIICELDDIYKNVLTYHYIEGMGAKEIASVLNKPLSTVKNQLTRGKAVFFEKIKEAGVYDEEYE